MAGPNPGAAGWQLKQLIRGLHAVDIGVMLELEICLTGEPTGGDYSKVSGIRTISAAYACPPPAMIDWDAVV